MKLLSRLKKSPAEAQVAISNERGIRYLHFGPEAIQGAMRISRPHALELEYTQDMMAALLFNPSPQRISILGLGAGSIAKFCLVHLPDAKIACAELSHAVVSVARQWFEVPQDDARFRVVVDDAGYWIKAEEARCDYLLVDLYDAAAKGPVLASSAFYTDCRQALERGTAKGRTGVMAVNLFGQHNSYRTNIANITAVFEGKVCVLPASARGNVVVLAFVGDDPAESAAELEPTLTPNLTVRAAQLQASTGLAYPRYLRDWQNRAARA